MKKLLILSLLALSTSALAFDLGGDKTYNTANQSVRAGDDSRAVPDDAATAESSVAIL